MLKTNVWMLMAGLILGGGLRAYSLPPEAAELEKSRAATIRMHRQLMKDTVPELYAFQAKLRSIEAKLKKIEANLAGQVIDRETAKEDMLPLIRQQLEIQIDPEFLVEQRLAQVYFASPEYRNKAEKVLYPPDARRGPRPLPSEQD